MRSVGRSIFALMFTLLFVPVGLARADDKNPLDGVRRVVFLGDSITYSGQYIEYLEALLRLQHPTLKTEFLNIGLPSETTSGLSEPGHAGGCFPRPTVHERLRRVLEQAKPDFVIACYGMNDGIYYPYGPDRFAQYQKGIETLHDEAVKAGAKIIHITPPVFDAVPIKARTLPAGRESYHQPYEGYDDVLNLYAAWLLAMRGQGWTVIDIHTPMRRALDDARKTNPKFHFAGDGVHADAAGHWLIARAILQAWNQGSQQTLSADSAESAVANYPHGGEILKLVQEKQRLLKDAWLSATGHKRPGMKKGVPIDEANEKAKAIEAKIASLLGPGK